MKIILAILLLLHTNLSMASICSVENDVEEYFLSIPAEELKIADDNKGYLNKRNERNNAIDVLDIKNGFISLQNETILSYTEIVLYRTSEGRPVILVTSDGASVQNTHAFACFNEQWHNVKNLIFPEISYEKISDLYKTMNIPINSNAKTATELSKVAHTLVRYKLPRSGKVIQVYASHPDLESPEKYILYEFKPALGKIKWQ